MQFIAPTTRLVTSPLQRSRKINRHPLGTPQTKLRVWVVQIFNRFSGLNSRLANWFPDREFFMRSQGQVKFLKVSSRLQMTAAGIVAGALLFWVAAMLFAAVNQYMITQDRIALNEKQAAVASSESRVAEYRGNIDKVAADLNKRQDHIELITETYFDEDAVKAAVGSGEVVAPETQPSDSVKEASETADKVSALIPEAASLAKVEARQLAFVDYLTRMAEKRTKAAETAIRKFGLNPAKMRAAPAAAQGGPFLPFFGREQEDRLDPRFEKLSAALARMDSLERSLVGIPSGNPADANAMTSNFGYRSDPFTRRAAMHSGIDFKGVHGQPILAAAYGKISFTGRKSGYGNVIEISHGNGIITRYAHLSSIKVKRGQRVTKGQRIGGMGSTGRSTGTHLHFEVRLNGRAINPSPFLKANEDVLKTQSIAEQRAYAGTD